MVQKHVAFAPEKMGTGPIFCMRMSSFLQNGACPHLFPRLRSPLLRRETVPAQPFSRFFHHTAFAKLENQAEWTGEYV